MHRWLTTPLALYLLAVLPVLSLVALLARRRRRRALAAFGSPPVLAVMLARQGRLRRLRGFCWTTGLTLLVVGVAGPRWGRDWAEAATGRDVVVVLDMSRSMLAEQPSRFQRAKASLADLCDTVQRRGGHRLGLVVFAGHGRIVCPLTHDYDHFRDVLDQLDPEAPPVDLAPHGEGASGTRIGAGLLAAVEGAHDDRATGSQDIILISDGDDPARDEEWRRGAAAARQRGIPVHVVGVGDPDTPSLIPGEGGPMRHDGVMVFTRLEEAPLQEIAELTGGTYTPAHTRELKLGELFRTRIEPRPVREGAEDSDHLPVPRQRYQWFFGGTLALLAGALALGRV